MMIISALSTTTGRADCQTNLKKCDEAVESCKAALEARKEEIKLCRLGLSQSLDRNDQLARELDDKNSQLQKFYRNPFIMTTLGVVIGIVVTGLATK